MNFRMIRSKLTIDKSKGLKMRRNVLIALIMMVAISTFAAGVTYKDGDKYVKFGGRIQLQYHSEDSGDETTDELIFRRLRPYIEGSVHKDWTGKFQFDLGKGKVSIKDAYMAYKGVDGMKIAIGNANFPFSRELLTSSKYQQIVERTFVGSHDYGTPERQAGIHLTGELAEGLFTYGASVAKASHDPDEKKLDFDTVVSHGAGDDWSEGEMIGGRVDFHPLGKLKMSQGDFDRDVKATIGVAAFTWNNDGDNRTPYAAADPVTGEGGHTSALDLDTATGMEVSAAIRGAGLSVDAQYNTFNAELMDAGISSGIYKNSETTLSSYSIEGGYMVVPSKLEVVVGYQSQDADGYAKAWNKTSAGLNYFVKKHDIKYQLTYQIGENKDGQDGSDVDEVYIQAQYVF